MTKKHFLPTFIQTTGYFFAKVPLLDPPPSSDEVFEAITTSRRVFVVANCCHYS
jgi:hypothetical protein